MLTYTIIGLTFFLYFGIAIWARAESTGEFYIANRRIHPVTNGMAIAADWISATSFFSLAGLVAFVGYDNSIYLMGWTGGFVLLAMLIAPYLRKFGMFSVPEFIGDRFYSHTARMVAVVCLIIISLTLAIGQMTGVGIAFSRFFGVNTNIGLFIGAGIVFIYTIFGGMKGVTYTQVVQYCVLITAYSIPAIFISLQLTGVPIPQFGLFSSTEIGIPLLTKLNQVIKDLGFESYTEHHSNTLNMMLFTLSLMIGTAGLPHVIIRFTTVPKVADARLSAGWALVFIALLYTIAPSVGAMARLNLTSAIQIGEVGSPKGNLSYLDRPEWFKNWEINGLLKFEDKNFDGRIQYYNDKSESFKEYAQNFGWQGSELTVNRDILVLANPEIVQLPNWVIALLAAGGLAAALSSLAGLMLAISVAISHDVVKRTINSAITQRQELIIARFSLGGAIGVATLLSLNSTGLAVQTITLAFGLAAASIFPTLVIGIFIKSMNNKGAVIGMLSGLIFTLSYIFWYKGWLFIQGTNFSPDTAEYWVFGISPHSIGAVGAVINFTIAYVVSRSTEESPMEIQELVENIRVPRSKKKDYSESLETAVKVASIATTIIRIFFGSS